MHRSRGASLHIAPKRRAHAPLVVLDLHTVAAVDLLHLRLEVLIAARKCVHARPLVVVAPVLIEETDGSHGAVIRHTLKRAALVHQEGQDGVALRDDLVGLLGHDRAERQAAQARVEDVRLEGGAHVLVQHAVGLRDHGLGLVAPRVEEEVLEPRVLRAVVGAGARVGAELGLAREGDQALDDALFGRVKLRQRLSVGADEERAVVWKLRVVAVLGRAGEHAAAGELLQVVQVDLLGLVGLLAIHDGHADGPGLELVKGGVGLVREECGRRGVAGATDDHVDEREH